MRWSQTHINTLKEAPSDAEIPSHKLLIRGGYIKKLAPGLYSYSPLALKAIRKFESIVREELDKRGCIEILMPVVHPRELWEETNRWTEMGPGLLKFQNRNDHWFCLAATHEEAITDYIRSDIKSYRDLPKTFYQIQTKYRDEIRPRFGLMRGREFSMKDAYSFDLNKEAALLTYKKMYEAYQAIFDRLEVKYRIVQADAGNIGGSLTHEFQLLAEAGEDSLLVGDSSDFAANIEVCPAIDPGSSSQSEASNSPAAAGTGLALPIEKFSTPNKRTISELAKFTGLPEKELVKTLFFKSDEKESKLFCVLLRGSDEVNLVKVKNLLNLANPPLMATDQEIKNITGASPGSCGPIGLKLPIYMDHGVSKMKNYIVGANEDGFHLKNVNHPRDFQATEVADLRMARAGDLCPSGKGTLQAFRGIEVGHVFYLGTKYSDKMKAQYLDREGKSIPIEMGCFGIGITRTIQAVIEQSHDADGIIWPLALAPYQVHICALDIQDEKLMSLANSWEKELESLGYQVLLDDRDERPGVKFKDADLLGMPFRIVLGKKGLEKNEIELVIRATKEQRKLKVDEVIPTIRKLLKN